MEKKPNRFLGVLICLGLYFAIMLPQLVLMTYIGLNRVLDHAFSGFQLAVVLLVFLAVIAGFLFLAHYLKVLVKSPLSFKTMGITLGLGYLGIILFNLLGAGLMSLQGVETTANQEAIIEVMKQAPALLMFVMIVVAAPITEELLCRAFIPYFLFKRQGLGIIVGSIVFMLLHIPTDIGSAVIYGGMSCVLGLVAYKTKRIEYSILLHGVNNLIAFLLLMLAK